MNTVLSCTNQLVTDPSDPLYLVIGMYAAVGRLPPESSRVIETSGFVTSWNISRSVIDVIVEGSSMFSILGVFKSSIQATIRSLFTLILNSPLIGLDLLKFSPALLYMVV